MPGPPQALADLTVKIMIKNEMTSNMNDEHDEDVNDKGVREGVTITK